MLARLLLMRGMNAAVFERDTHADERPQGGSLDLHADTGQRAMRVAELETQFSAEARPEHQGDRLYDQHGTLLFDRDGEGDDRPEIDRTALRRILLDSLPPDLVRWDSRIESIKPLASGGHEVAGRGFVEQFDIVVGADGAWSNVRPLVSDAAPSYGGVTLVELGFDTQRHPAVDALTGSGKMFAVGDNRALIAQRNGLGHIRGYAGVRMPEDASRYLAQSSVEDVRAIMLEAFAAWSPELTHLIEVGDVIGIRPMYALPIGHHWPNQPRLTLLGDAAHLMSPFSGEGVNLALADAVDLAEALSSGEGWPAIERYEAIMVERSAPAAEGAAAGLNAAFSPAGVDSVLAHYLERVAVSGPENRQVS